MTELPQNTCQFCAHCAQMRIDPTSISQQSVCRRYPPHPQLLPNGQFLVFFPMVTPDMSCGEFKANEH